MDLLEPPRRVRPLQEMFLCYGLVDDFFGLTFGVAPSRLFPSRFAEKCNPERLDRTPGGGSFPAKSESGSEIRLEERILFVPFPTL